jgi:PKD repeat protein
MGSPYGPHHGLGDNVTDYVLYYPWLSTPSGPPVEPPTANFTYSPSVPKAGETITFDASSSTPNGGTITEYKWDFGDGNITTTPDATIPHVYGTPSTYNVTLTVTDSEGLNDTTWQLVTVVSAVKHDIAIINITTNTHYAYPGRIVNITVVVKNNGEAPENFNVTTYRNSTPIGTILVTGLGVGENTTLIFNWNTSGLAPCNTWTISAEAPLVGDINPGDNTLADGTVKIKIIGDVNGDGRVDIDDLVLIVAAIPSYPGHPEWNPQVDLNGDNIVDIADIVIALGNFLKSCP